jgi:hypothetical protein
VGNAGSEGADGLHLLNVLQLHLQALAFGDVVIIRMTVDSSP